MKKTILVLASAVFLLAACGDNATENEAPNTAQTVDTPEPPASGVEMTSAGAAIITLRSGDDMKFDLAEIKVKEGQKVMLTLYHTGKAPKSAMGHNFVLLAQGVSVNDFSNEAINAKDNDYIPVGKEKDVIAHTKLLGGGESDTIEFAAPTKGTYNFLCSFPGHAAMMRGIFVVE